MEPGSQSAPAGRWPGARTRRTTVSRPLRTRAVWGWASENEGSLHGPATRLNTGICIRATVQPIVQWHGGARTLYYYYYY